MPGPGQHLRVHGRPSGGCPVPISKKAGACPCPKPSPPAPLSHMPQDPGRWAPGAHQVGPAVSPPHLESHKTRVARAALWKDPRKRAPSSRRKLPNRLSRPGLPGPGQGLCPDPTCEPSLPSRRGALQHRKPAPRPHLDPCHSDCDLRKGKGPKAGSRLLSEGSPGEATAGWREPSRLGNGQELCHWGAASPRQTGGEELAELALPTRLPPAGPPRELRGI